MAPSGFGSFSRGSTRQASPAQFVLANQIIQAAMGVGVVLFGGVIVFMSRLQAAAPAKTATDDGLLKTLSAANLIAFGVLGLLALVLPGLVANYEKVFRQAAPGPGGPEEPALRFAFQVAYAKARILRLATLESSALLGLVVCLMGVLSNAKMDAHPAYWANALPAAFFVLYVVASFPTRQNVEALFQDKLAAAKVRFPGISA